MTKPAYLLGGLLFLADLILNGALILNNATILGLFSLISGVLVYGCGMIWLIRRDDETLHLGRLALILPIGIFGAALAKTLIKSGFVFQSADENLQEIGNVMMARYQVGLWLMGAITLMIFVIAGSLMTVRRRG